VTVEKTMAGIRARAIFDSSQLPDVLRQQLTDQIRPLLSLAGQPPPATPAAAASASHSIVIEGLDDGPRVIPVQK
jgi:hypothetical protein